MVSDVTTQEIIESLLSHIDEKKRRGAWADLKDVAYVPDDVAKCVEERFFKPEKKQSAETFTSACFEYDGSVYVVWKDGERYLYAEKGSSRCHIYSGRLLNEPLIADEFKDKLSQAMDMIK